MGLREPNRINLAGNVMKRATLDHVLLERRIQHLQRKGIVINTGRRHITRDDMTGWVHFIFEREMGAQAEWIKVISRTKFLVIVSSFEEQQKILRKLSLYMNGKILVAVPWATDLKLKPIGPNDTPIWIDLLSVDPLLEIYSNYLLNQVGRLVFANTFASLNRYANIHGCVLMDLDKPITTQVEIVVPRAGMTSLDVVYKSLAFTYSFCHEYGHPEKLCITKWKNDEHTLLKMELDKARAWEERASDVDGFKKVLP